jgi:hypothetical protein
LKNYCRLLPAYHKVIHRLSTAACNRFISNMIPW